MSGAQENRFLDQSEVKALTSYYLTQHKRHFDRLILEADLSRNKKNLELDVDTFAAFDGYITGIGLKKVPQATVVLATPTTLATVWGGKSNIKDHIYRIIYAYILAVEKLNQNKKENEKISYNFEWFIFTLVITILLKLLLTSSALAFLGGFWGILGIAAVTTLALLPPLYWHVNKEHSVAVAAPSDQNKTLCFFFTDGLSYST